MIWTRAGGAEPKRCSMSASIARCMPYTRQHAERVARHLTAGHPTVKVLDAIAQSPEDAGRVYGRLRFLPLLALGLPAIMTQVGEGLPPGIRSGGIGIIYAVAIAAFGGTASLVVTWLTKVTGSPLAPAGYMCAALVVGVCCMFALRETAPVKTGG